MTKAFSVQKMVLCALFAALIAAGAFIKVPVPVVPFTLQFLFTTLAGIFLGARTGAASVILYLILGLAGLPIFAQGGGPGYVMMPSFGYLIGFAAGTWITGRMIERRPSPGVKQLLAANFSGLIAVYVIGMAYYYVICNYVLGTPIAFWPLFLYCFLMAVPGDLLICIVCAVLGQRILPQVRRYIK